MTGVRYGSHDASSKATLNFSGIAVQGYPLATRTENAALYPALPNGTMNTFSRFLHWGGTASGQSTVGSWQRASTVANTATEVSTTFSGALTQNGRTALYSNSRGWGHTTTDIGAVFTLWDAPGISGICGGANVPSARNCPYYGFLAPEYPNHFDTSSARFLYVR